MKKNEEPKRYWICVNNPAECEQIGVCINLTGEADCELCEKFLSCDVCGRKGMFCTRCVNNPEGIYNVKL